MATEKQRRTFISYSRANKEFAVKLANELKSNGYTTVWLDQLDISTGSRWDDEVEKALRECSIFMIILTPASIASENVKDEIGYAIDHGKRILPVLLETCDIPLRLRRFQYVDFTTKSFDEGIESAKQLLTNPISAIVTKQENEAKRPVQAQADLVCNAKEESDLLAAQKAKADAEAEAKPLTGNGTGCQLMLRVSIMLVFIMLVSILGIWGKNFLPVNPTVTLIPIFTFTPTYTPTPTYTFTPTPIVCPYQRVTDDETIVALIQAEVVAAQGKYMNIINDIFDPDAIFQDYAGTPASAATPAAEWHGALTRYQEVFATVDFKDSRHFDILPAGLGISGETATYTSGSDITYKKVGSDLWTHQINGSINSTNYGSEHWVLKKNTNGCWIIAQMEINAGHIQFP